MLSIFSLVISIVRVFITAFIAVFIYRFNRRVIRFQNTRYLIESWQMFNRLAISDDQNIEALKEFYEGQSESNKVIRKKYLAFVLLNILQHEYFSYKDGMADEGLALSDLKDQARMLSKDRLFVSSIIKGRGFEEEFVEFLNKELSSGQEELDGKKGDSPECR